MSPTEDELRAALRDGEGDGPDAGRIIGQAERTRARRRSRLLNTAATVAIVAAVGGGGTWLLHGTGNDEKSGSSSNQSAAGGVAAGAGGPQASSSPSARAALLPSSSEALSCDGSLPRVLTPASPQAGDDLFSAPVSKLVVCAWSDVSGRPAPLIITGAQAQAIVTSLESAPTVHPGGMCPAYRIAGERTAELTGIAADGRVVGRVTATLDRPTCASVVTNGRIVRFGWRPPTPLLSAISRHLPVGGAAVPTK